MTLNKDDRVCLDLEANVRGTVVRVAKDGEVAIQLDNGGVPMYYPPQGVFLIEEGENEVNDGWTHPFTVIKGGE